MTNMTFSLARAEQLSPDRIQQRIIRKIEQMDDNRAFIADQAFPLYQMGAAKEIYHRQNGLRAPMQGTSLVSESPVASLEDLDEDEMSVTTLKEKISPERAVDETLNNEQQILNIAEYVSDALRMDLLTSRSMMAWRGWNGVEGMIGETGTSAHSRIPTDHVITPSAAFSDEANSDPHDVFMTAQERIDIDGTGFNSLPPITAYCPPEVIWDLKRNDDLQDRFSGVRVRTIDTMDDLSQVIPIRIREIRTKVARTNANGEPIDENDNVVSVNNAVDDNILEPYDPGSGTQTRNVVIGTFGREAALMPWFPDRLASHLDNTPSPNWSVDRQNGYLLQSWTQNDPAISWRKIAQEIGFHVLRGENFCVLQDV